MIPTPACRATNHALPSWPGMALVTLIVLNARNICTLSFLSVVVLRLLRLKDFSLFVPHFLITTGYLVLLRFWFNYLVLDLSFFSWICCLLRSFNRIEKWWGWWFTKIRILSHLLFQLPVFPRLYCRLRNIVIRRGINFRWILINNLFTQFENRPHFCNPFVFI